jgi:hypothetical protein
LTLSPDSRRSFHHCETDLMSDMSPRLDLPYLQPSQAQKHVTHNEALQRLDALVQPAVLAIGSLTPPTAPAPGDMHIPGPGATGVWAGQADTLAQWDGSAWQFLQPRDGWRVHDLETGQGHVFRNGSWQVDLPDLNNLEQVGIGTTADAQNRLAVAAASSLFTHAGSDHRVTVNKAGAGDTASLLFQSGWTGHAEIGLTGDTALAVKVSPDGTAWHEALRMDPASGEIALAPTGPVRARLSEAALQLDVPLTGTAVQEDGYDATSGRMTRTGAFGIGRSAGSYPAQYAFSNFSINPSGAYWYNKNTGDPGPSNFGAMLAFNYAATAQMRIAVDSGGGQMWFNRIHETDGETSWNRVVHLNNLIGPVSEAGGVPTGAVIERGSNANGEYVRWADGTQICTNDNAAITTAPAAFTGPITRIDGDKLWIGRWF